MCRQFFCTHVWVREALAWESALAKSGQCCITRRPAIWSSPLHHLLQVVTARGAPPFAGRAMCCGCRNEKLRMLRQCRFRSTCNVRPKVREPHWDGGLPSRRRDSNLDLEPQSVIADGVQSRLEQTSPTGTAQFFASFDLAT